MSSKGLVRFAGGICRELFRGDGNVFVSPYGVWSAMAMVASAARGETRRELDEALFDGGDGEPLVASLREQLESRAKIDPRFGGANTYGFTLSVANALFRQLHYALHPQYTETLSRAHRAESRAVDFRDPEGAARAVNEWAAEKTERRITRVVGAGDLPSQLRAILANATYFKAAWLANFSEMWTQPAPFHRLDATTTEVQMMRQTHGFRYFEHDGVQVVALAYVNPKVSMVFLVPPLGSFERFEQAPPSLDVVLDGLGHREVELHLPRLELRWRGELTDALKAIGARAVFGESADLSGASDEPGLAVGKVIQETFLKLDEKGTEAAAVTLAVVAAAAMMDRPRPVLVRIDRPFWAFIVDEPTRTVLFAARVIDP